MDSSALRGSSFIRQRRELAERAAAKEAAEHAKDGGVAGLTEGGRDAQDADAFGSLVAMLSAGAKRGGASKRPRAAASRPALPGPAAGSSEAAGTEDVEAAHADPLPELPALECAWEEVFGGGGGEHDAAAIRKAGQSAASRRPARTVRLCEELMPCAVLGGKVSGSRAVGAVLTSSDAVPDPAAGMAELLTMASARSAATRGRSAAGPLGLAGRLVDVSSPAEGGVRPRVAALWAGKNPVPDPEEADEVLRSAGGEDEAGAAARQKAWRRRRKRVEAEAAAEAGPGAGGESAPRGYMGEAQQLLWRHLRQYRDISHTAWTWEADSAIRSVIALHVADHAVRARERVRRHNTAMHARVARRRAERQAERAEKGAAAGRAMESAAADGSTMTLLEQRAAELAEGEAGSDGQDSEEDDECDANPGEKADDDDDDDDENEEAPAAKRGKRSRPALEAAGDEEAYRDQGFTRPRVLLVCPTRHRALVMVRQILALLPGREVTNLRRFLREFADEGADPATPAAPRAEHDADWRFRRVDRTSIDAVAASLAPPPAPLVEESALRAARAAGGGHGGAARQGAGEGAEDGDEAEDGDGEEDGSRGKARVLVPLPMDALGRLDLEGIDVDALPPRDRRRVDRHRVAPADHRLAFTGNVDDAFRLGVQVGRKQTRLYANFYASDILVASPLGLRLAIAKAAGEDGAKPGARDFLSSVEVCVLDGCHELLQQNWEHVDQLGRLLNERPEATRETDVGRVRLADLDGLGRHRRQTVVLSERDDPELRAWLRQRCSNARGWVGIAWESAGAVGRIVPVVRQVFQRVPAPSLAARADARLAFFDRVILPRLRAAATREAGTQQYTLVVAASSLEYVRLRNYLDREDVEFAPVSEHTPSRDTVRARGLFRMGEAPILLTTERWFHYNRLTLRGTRHIIFYGAPRVEETYVEPLNSLAKALAADQPVSSLLLYDRYEAAAVERLVGTERAAALLAREDSSSSSASSSVARLRAAKGGTMQRSTFVFVNDPAA